MSVFTKTWVKMLASISLLAVVVGSAIWYWQSASPVAPPLRTAAVRRGVLVATVSATGTIEPQEVVDVGAQVIGMIKEFGCDPNESTRSIDYLSVVEEGTVLARIDDAIYRARFDRAAAQVEQAQAQIEQARADLRRAEANTQQSQAKYQESLLDWERAKKLVASQIIPQEEYDAKQAGYLVAKADLSVSEAAADQARANKLATEKALVLAEADCREARQNLDYTVIRSPVKGVIVDRRVNVGQTVVSSLSAPSLFLIAKDLKRLQVWASVNEADVGRLSPRQTVRYTVDAFPDEIFLGQVSQVRLNAMMTQNVVTYTVVVETDNSSGKLLPYLTANLQFEVGRRANALLVPNAALRWQPRPEQISPDGWQQLQHSQERVGATGPGAIEPGEEKNAHERGVVWVAANGLLRPIEVRLGLSDGVETEVLGGELREEQAVVIGEELSVEADGTASPFAPHMFGGRGR